MNLLFKILFALSAFISIHTTPIKNFTSKAIFTILSYDNDEHLLSKENVFPSQIISSHDNSAYIVIYVENPVAIEYYTTFWYIINKCDGTARSIYVPFQETGLNSPRQPKRSNTLGDTKHYQVGDVIELESVQSILLEENL